MACAKIRKDAGGRSPVGDFVLRPRPCRRTLRHARAQACLAPRVCPCWAPSWPISTCEGTPLPFVALGPRASRTEPYRLGAWPLSASPALCLHQIVDNQFYSYANWPLWRSAGGKRVYERILLDTITDS